MNKIHKGKCTQVQLVIRDSCTLCTEINDKLDFLLVNDESVQFTVINLDRGETAPNNIGNVITPSTFINNRLWKIGDFEISVIQNKLDSFRISEPIKINL